jgi:hypothetical protein
MTRIGMTRIGMTRIGMTRIGMTRIGMKTRDENPPGARSTRRQPSWL